MKLAVKVENNELKIQVVKKPINISIARGGGSGGEGGVAYNDSGVKLLIAQNTASIQTTATATSAEITAREAANTALTLRIDNLPESISEEDVDSKILQETNSRISADDTEREARERTYTSLGGEIGAEQATRSTDDRTLGGLIASEATSRTDADAGFDTRLLAEMSSRTGSDTDLGNRISTEKGLSTDADTALGLRIDTNETTNAATHLDIRNEIANIALPAAPDTGLTEAQVQVLIDVEVGIRSNADIGLVQDILTESRTRTAADNNLTTVIETEASTRESADSMEATVRALADTLLGERIDALPAPVPEEDIDTKIAAEATVRAAADTAEATSREQGDTDLGTRIDGLPEPVSEDDIDAKIAAETTARATADTSEATAREQADIALRARIDALPAQGTGGLSEAQIQALIDVEATARTSADSVEASTRSRQDIGITASLSGETTARTNADIALGDRIDALPDPISETDIDGKVAAEATIRAAADTLLTSRLDALPEFVEETEIDAKIAVEAAIRAAADTLLTSRLDALPEFVEEFEIDGKVAAEATLRIAGDTGLGTRITDAATLNAQTHVAIRTEIANIALPDAPDTGLTEAQVQVLIDVEMSLRASGDIALGQRIDALPDPVSETDIDGKIAVEAAIRAAADTLLTSRLDALPEFVEEFEIDGKVAAEATLRIAGDTGLGTRITDAATLNAQTHVAIRTEIANIALPTAPDTGLTEGQVQVLIDVEMSLRAAGDIALGQRIDALPDPISETDIDAKVLAEMTARVAGDAALTRQLGLESLQRQSADSVLRIKIDALPDPVSETDIDAKIAVEAAIRAAADTALTSRIDALPTSVLEDDIDAKVAAEATLRGAGDTALGTRITDAATLNAQTHVAIRTEIANIALPDAPDTGLTEGQVQALVDVEMASRSAADIALGQRIDTTLNRINAETGNRITVVAAEAAARTQADVDINLRIDNLPDELSEAQVETLIAVETTAREGADTTLSNRIDALPDPVSETDIDAKVLAEMTARVDGDAALTRQLGLESLQRQSADIVLGNRIDNLPGHIPESDIDAKVAAEASLRASADDRFGNRLSSETGSRIAAISAETTARTDADTVLTNRINILPEPVSEADIDLKIGVEASARTAADSTESTARTSADTALGTRIDNLPGHIPESDIDAKVAAEASLRASADDRFGNRLSSETGTRIAAIASEATTRGSADTRLNRRIDNLPQQLSEVQIDAKITTETSARIAADALLARQLGNEGLERQRIDAINAITISIESTTRESDISSEALTRTTADNALGIRIDSLQTSLPESDVDAKIAVEATLRSDADTSLTNRITQEARTSSQGDVSLSSRIDSLSLGPTSDDLTDAIALEVTNRTNSDDSLRGLLDGEVVLRTAGDTALGDRIDGLTETVGTGNLEFSSLAKKSLSDLSQIPFLDIEPSHNGNFSMIARVGTIAGNASTAGFSIGYTERRNNANNALYTKRGSTSRPIPDVVSVINNSGYYEVAVTTSSLISRTTDRSELETGLNLFLGHDSFRVNILSTHTNAQIDISVFRSSTPYPLWHDGQEFDRVLVQHTYSADGAATQAYGLTERTETNKRASLRNVRDHLGIESTREYLSELVEISPTDNDFFVVQDRQPALEAGFSITVESDVLAPTTVTAGIASGSVGWTNRVIHYRSGVRFNRIQYNQKGTLLDYHVNPPGLALSINSKTYSANTVSISITATLPQTPPQGFVLVQATEQDGTSTQLLSGTVTTTRKTTTSSPNALKENTTYILSARCVTSNSVFAYSSAELFTGSAEDMDSTSIEIYPKQEIKGLFAVYQADNLFHVAIEKGVLDAGSEVELTVDSTVHALVLQSEPSTQSYYVDIYRGNNVLTTAQRWSSSQTIENLQVQYGTDSTSVAPGHKSIEVTRSVSFEDLNDRLTTKPPLIVVDGIATVTNMSLTDLYYDNSNNTFYRFETLPGDTFEITSAHIHETLNYYGWGSVAGAGTPPQYVSGGSLGINDVHDAIAIYSDSRGGQPNRTRVRVAFFVGGLDNIEVDGVNYPLTADTLESAATDTWGTIRYDEYVTTGDPLGFDATTVGQKRLIRIEHTGGTVYLGADDGTVAVARDIFNSGDRNTFTDIDRRRVENPISYTLPEDLRVLDENITLGDSTIRTTVITPAALGRSRGVGVFNSRGYRTIESEENLGSLSIDNDVIVRLETYAYRDAVRGPGDSGVIEILGQELSLDGGLVIDGVAYDLYLQGHRSSVLENAHTFTYYIKRGPLLSVGTTATLSVKKSDGGFLVFGGTPNLTFSDTVVANYHSLRNAPSVVTQQEYDDLSDRPEDQIYYII